MSLGSVLGPAFASDHSMFSVDEFHPSAAGYAQAAAVLLPSVADAVGVWPAAADRGVRPIRRGTVRPVAQAAARAASRTGTEVQPAEVRGSDTGPLGTVGAAAPAPSAGDPHPRAGGGVGGRIGGRTGGPGRGLSRRRLRTAVVAGVTAE